MIPVTRIKITMDERGKGKVYVDDVDWTDRLSGIETVSHAGEKTKVILHLCLAEIDAEFPAALSTPLGVYAYG